MSAYGLSVLLYELKDLVSLLVPFLVALVVCAAGYFAWRRWLAARSDGGGEATRRRLEALETRVKALEERRGDK